MALELVLERLLVHEIICTDIPISAAVFDIRIS